MVGRAKEKCKKRRISYIIIAGTKIIGDEIKLACFWRTVQQHIEELPR